MSRRVSRPVPLFHPRRHLQEPAEEPVEEPATGEEGETSGDAGEDGTEEPAEEPANDGAPVANALVYTGEAQALVSAGEGWLFSTDGQTYAPEIPTAVDAGEYTVYYVPAGTDGEVRSLVAIVSKADVVLIPPEAADAEA